MAKSLGLVAEKKAYVGPSFTLQHRLRRVVWNVIYVLAFRPSPRPLFAWRSALLRAFGAKVGNSVKIYPKCRIWAPWNLVLEDNSSAGDDSQLYSVDVITLQRESIVSQGAYICTGTHDYTDPDFQLVASPITIGVRAWVGANAFVNPGVTVADGSVVGAMSVVNTSTAPWQVYAGNPARIIAERKQK